MSLETKKLDEKVEQEPIPIASRRMEYIERFVCGVNYRNNYTSNQENTKKEER